MDINYDVVVSIYLVIKSWPIFPSHLHHKGSTNKKTLREKQILIPVTIPYFILVVIENKYLWTVSSEQGLFNLSNQSLVILFC